MASYQPIPEVDEEDDFDVPIPDDEDDDDNGNETGVFGPLSSTPYQTEQKEKRGLHEPPVFLEEFPNADKTKIKYKMDGKGRTEVGLIAPKKKFYRLLTEIPGESGKYQINPRLPKEVLRALGESRRETIQKEIRRLSEGIIDNKKIAEDTTKDQTERNKARERAQMQISSRLDQQKQLEQLKAGEYTRDGGGQSISLEVFQNNEEIREEKEKKIAARKRRTRKNHK